MLTHSPFFSLPGSVMALPNTLFSPVLSSCISALVVLLLLLLFLLYKYNQVRFPAAGQGLQGLPSLRGHTASSGSQGRTIQLGGTRQDASFTSPASQFPPGVSCCRAKLRHPIQCINTSPALVLQSCSQRSVWSLFGVRQRCSLCAVSCPWFCSGPHKFTD